jgi:two-component system chemotaxis response regulator CheB
VKPDVITMDIHMPKLNGFEATRRIMENCPAPIVIVSGSTARDDIANHRLAIEAGAVAVVPRPNGLGHPDQEATAKLLLDTIKLMSEIKVIRRWPVNGSSPRTIPQFSAKRTPGPTKAVFIGASAGGPLVLQTILTLLPKDFPVPVLIVQHMAPGFVSSFVEWLSHASGYPVGVAEQGELLAAGHAYIAPDGFHLAMGADHRVVLSQDALENGVRPAVSFLFRSAEAVFGPNVIAVLLTGMGEDGARELKRLKDAGAITIAQDQESSIVHGMPGQAIKLGAATHVLPPESIAKALTSFVAKL